MMDTSTEYLVDRRYLFCELTIADPEPPVVRASTVQFLREGWEQEVHIFESAWWSMLITTFFLRCSLGSTSPPGYILKSRRSRVVCVTAYSFACVIQGRPHPLLSPSVLPLHPEESNAQTSIIIPQCQLPTHMLHYMSLCEVCSLLSL